MDGGEKMAEPEVRSEEERPQENIQPSPENAPPAEPAGKEEASCVEREIKQILAKMPVKDKEALQKDYGSIQYINITYQGNHVENSGTVYGGISQRQEDSSRVGSSPSAETIQDFFGPNARADNLAALLALASLESVQENLFYEIALHLSKKLKGGTEPSESEKTGALAYLQTVDELLAPFPIQRKALSSLYGDAELDLQYLAFCDGQIPDRVRNWAWRMYPQLRPILTDWLLDFQTRTAGAAGRALAHAAVRGLAVYASLDAEYACHHIIPLLEDRCTTQADIKYLVTFARQFIQAADCRMVGDELLRRWCGKSKFFWQVPYQLYSDKARLRFCENVPGALRKRLQQDCGGLGRSDPEWYGQNRGYFLYPAHRNSASASLLAKEIAGCFSDCKTLQDRYQTAVYFLVLFRWDYLTDFSSAPELCFLKCFHDKETRDALLPVFQFIWRHVELRDAMRQVLECHFAEIGAKGATASYLERPFEFLAFTRNRIDYQNTLKLLKDCAKQRDAQAAASHLMNHLTGIFQQRQTIKSTRKV